MNTTCSGTFDAGSPALDRAGRLTARRFPEWTFRYLPDAVPSRRWRAQTRRPLTRAEITLGRPGALYGATLDAVAAQVRAARMAAFVRGVRRWRR